MYGNALTTLDAKLFDDLGVSSELLTEVYGVILSRKENFQNFGR